MVDQDQDLVDVAPYDPGDGSLPVFRWKQAGRANLATRRQLREMGLRPGGQDPVARIDAAAVGASHGCTGSTWRSRSAR